MAVGGLPWMRQQAALSLGPTLIINLPVRRRASWSQNVGLSVTTKILYSRAQRVENVGISLYSPGRLVEELKFRLERDHRDLPVGKNGRDDEELLLWFLKDRKFDVDAAVGKLVKTLIWRRDFGVNNLTNDSVKNIAATRQAYLHNNLDVKRRPVVVVVAANHIPARDDLVQSEKLCVYLIEKALHRLPKGCETILGIFDLRGFTSKNADLKFTSFLVEVFYYYYPKRLGEVLFVDAPFLFQPCWNIVKPWLKSYASLVRFCTIDVVREEYFTPDTIPPDFRTN
eukprot:c27364_g1_i4 orf=476-1327(-)